MNIKPIETYYNGYRFRSRLEARWAVFFDAMGIKYQYEPEGFLLSNNEPYLPDFYLYEVETYVEVKPENAFEIELTNDGVLFPEGFCKYAYASETITMDMGKMFLIVFGDPYHAFPRLDNGKTEAKSHLFYVGECATHFILKTANKQIGEKKFYCKTIDGEEKDCSLCDKWGKITAHAFPLLITPETVVITDDAVIREHLLPYWVLEDSKKYKSEWLKSHKAQLEARQARFEHGEMPNIGGHNK